MNKVEFSPNEVKAMTKLAAEQTVKPYLGFLSLLVVISFIAIIASFFIWIWGSGDIALKTFWSGAGGIVIFHLLHKIITLGVKKAVESIEADEAGITKK